MAYVHVSIEKIRRAYVNFFAGNPTYENASTTSDIILAAESMRPDSEVKEFPKDEWTKELTSREVNNLLSGMGESENAGAEVSSTPIMLHSLTSSQEHNLVTLINLLQNENEELKCAAHTLSSRNASLHEELLKLREKLESYRELETVVVPELKSKLESARSSLSCVEHDMALIHQEKQWMMQKLRKSTSVAKSSKAELETSFLEQLQSMEDAHRQVVTALEASLREKNNIIQSLEKSIQDYKNKLLRFESNLELDSIDSSQDLEYLRQQYLDSQEQVKQLQETILLMRKSQKECKDSNKKLLKDVEDLQQKLANAAIVELKDNIDAGLAATIVPAQQKTENPAFPTPSTLLINKQLLVVAVEGEDKQRIVHTKTSSDSSEHELWC